MSPLLVTTRTSSDAMLGKMHSQVTKRLQFRSIVNRNTIFNKRKTGMLYGVWLKPSHNIQDSVQLINIYLQLTALTVDQRMQ